MQQQALFGSALEAAFQEFHTANPDVYKLFCTYTFKVIQAGYRHYSARAIVHRIRWHSDIETYRGDDGFKINNCHSPYLARMFMRRNPKFKGFFHVREVKE